MAMPELDVLNEMRELTPVELFGEWLPQLMDDIMPAIAPAFAWLLENIEVAISIKLDDHGWTIKLSESGLEVEEGLKEDALVTMVVSEKDFMGILRGERKMAMMPPGEEPVDVTTFPEMVRQNIEILKGIEAVLLLKLEDPEKGDLVATVKFAGPMKEQPDIEVVVAQDVLEDMASGALDPAAAFILQGKVQVEGDVNLLMKLAMMMM